MYKDMEKIDTKKGEKLLVSYPTCEGIKKRKTFITLVNTGFTQILVGGHTMGMIGK